MDTKLALVKMITLIYRESQIIGNTDRSSELVTSVLGTIKTPRINVEHAEGKETIYHLKSTLLWMLEQPLGMIFDKEDLLVRLRCNISEQNNLFQSVSSAINQEMSETEQKQSCMNIRLELKDHLAQVEVKQLVSDLNKQTMTTSNLNVGDFCADVIERMEQYLGVAKSTKSKHEVARLSLDDPTGFKEIIEKGQMEETGTGGIQYGLQGLNRMFGHTGKMRLGEWWHIYALPHNYKSGLLMRLAIDTCLYNDPPDTVKPGYKPTIVRYSFENEAHRDAIDIFQYLYILEHKEKPDYTKITPEYMVQYTQERLGARGWHFEMLRFEPSDFTYRDLFDSFDALEAEKKHVLAAQFDYLNMISKHGCTQGAQGFETRDLIRRVRNFCSRKGILGINAHQLSTEAKAIIRGGFDQRKFLEEIEGKGYFDSCRAIDNEPDGEIYIHLYKNLKLDQVWLMFHRGKHRKVSITPEQDKSFCYLMDPLLGLPSDIYGSDLSYAKPGGMARSEEIDDGY